jgi:hypothetical protein
VRRLSTSSIDAFRPVLTGAGDRRDAREDPAAFAWKPPPYEYEHDRDPISSSPARRHFARRSIGRARGTGAGRWRDSVELFRELRRPYLLYT